jgi:regulator of protease activity HflC (stomatin/prohibitin superfamily)
MLLAFSIITGALVAAGIKIIPQQTVAVVETLGRYSRTATPGPTFVIPFIERVAARLDLRILKVDVDLEVKTADNLFIELPVSIMLSVIPEQANDAYYKLQDPTDSISKWVSSSLKATVASMTLADVYTDQVLLESEVRKTLAGQLMSYGYRIVTVLVDQPTVDEEVAASFSRVVVSKREQEAAVGEAAALRTRVVGQATAEADAMYLRAEGLAKARKILAESLTEAVRNASGEGFTERDVANLLLEVSRLDTIREVGAHGNMVVVDVSPENINRMVLPLKGHHKPL